MREEREGWPMQSVEGGNGEGQFLQRHLLSRMRQIKRRRQSIWCSEEEEEEEGESYFAITIKEARDRRRVTNEFGLWRNWSVI